MVNWFNNRVSLWTLLLSLVLVFASCNKNGSEPNGNGPGSGGGSEPSIPVVPGDPEGTVTINMNNYAVDHNNWYDIGIGCSLCIDQANNFTGPDLVSVGEVESLGYVTTIPNDGWANSVAVIPGYGYVARCSGYYARLFVVDYLISTEGGIIGATIKYQSPIIVPISLESSSLFFDNEGGTQIVRLSTPTSISIEEKPAWCTVSADSYAIRVSVTENNSIYQRVGEIILKNEVNTVVLSVSQQGYGFEGGNGTMQDPFQIKTAQQLAKVSIALDAHYKMIADIDLTSYLSSNGNGWEPIGKDMNSCFSGTFDGNGHTIRGIWVDGNSHDYAGLFGVLRDATIKGIIVVTDSKAIKGKKSVGGIAAYGMGIVSISRCVSSGWMLVLGDSGNGGAAGGICGGFDDANSSIKECYSEGQIYGNGMTVCCGVGLNCMIEDCYSTCTLEGYYCGGMDVLGNVTNCYFAGRAYGDMFCCEGSSTYYDSDMIGSGVGTIQGTEYGRTTIQMRRQVTYEGWDFVNTWRIDEGRDYPRLRCFD